MARKPMVTRTIITTKVDVLSMNVTNGEALNSSLVLPRTYKDDEKLLKILKNTYDTDTVKVVHIIDKTEVETLYGMTEEDFILNAKVLDPETRKAISTTTTVDEAEVTED